MDILMVGYPNLTATMEEGITPNWLYTSVSLGQIIW